MFRLFAVTFFSLLVISGFSQPNPTSEQDSLVTKLANLKSNGNADSFKITLTNLSLMSSYHKALDSANALKHFREGLSYANSDSARYLMYYARIHHFINAHKAHKVIELSKDLLSKANSYPYSTSFAYQGMGMAHSYLGDNETSLKYYQKALEEGKATNNIEWITNNQMDLGATYYQSGQIEKALIIYKEATDLLKSENIPLTESTVSAYANLGSIYFSVNLDSAIKYLTISRDLALQLNYSRTAAVGTTNLGSIYLKTKQFGKSETEFKLALKLFGSLKNYTLHPKIYNHLSRINAQKQNWNQSMAYADSAKKYEGINNQEALSKAVAEAKTKFGLVEEELKNEILTKEKEQAEDLVAFQRVIVLFIILILVSALAFIVALVRNRKTIKTLNNNLATKNKHLDDLLHEKDHLMGILIHDVRSPMASIQSATELIKDSKQDLDEETYNQLLSEMNSTSETGLEMINSIWEIYKLENQDMELETKHIKLKTILESIHGEFEPIAQKRNIELQFDETDIELSTNSSYLITVLRNLISNALKFSESFTQVQIISEINNNLLTLRVKDEGPGFQPEDFDKVFGKFQKLSAKPLHGEKSSGLGLYLIQLICKKLGGNIQLNKEVSKGAEFILTLPT